jgi:hypothetical protein
LEASNLVSVAGNDNVKKLPNEQSILAVCDAIVRVCILPYTEPLIV